MTVLRWILLVLTGLAALATSGTFAVFIITGVDVWMARSRAAWRWLYALGLLWFNLEVWRRVVLIIIHW